MARETDANPGRAPQGPVAGARTSPGAWALLLALTAVGLAGDLWTKALAFEHVAQVPVTVTRAEVIEAGPQSLGRLIPAHDPVTVIPSVLDFTLVLNPGAVFGIGAGQRWFFVAFTVLAMGVCLWMFGWWTTRRDRLAHVSFALVIAGGLGNLYDRLVFACVRDFIHPLPGVKLPFGLSWPSGEDELWPYVSNVADAYLIVGIAALVWFSFRAPAEEKPDRSEPERPAGG
ncbi:MAG: signal peptidase II [Phycisphaerales bacterium JB040]